MSARAKIQRAAPLSAALGAPVERAPGRYMPDGFDRNLSGKNTHEQRLSRSSLCS